MPNMPTKTAKVGNAGSGYGSLILLVGGAVALAYFIANQKTAPARRVMY